MSQQKVTIIKSYLYERERECGVSGAFYMDCL